MYIVVGDLLDCVVGRLYVSIKYERNQCVNCSSNNNGKIICDYCFRYSICKFLNVLIILFLLVRSMMLIHVGGSQIVMNCKLCVHTGSSAVLDNVSRISQWLLKYEVMFVAIATSLCLIRTQFVETGSWVKQMFGSY